MLKRLGRDPAWQRRFASMVATSINVLDRTCQFSFEAHPDTLRLFNQEEGILAGYWHGRLLLLPMIWHRVAREVRRSPTQDVHALASGHRDGAIMAEALRMLGIATIKGSTGHSGAHAFREIRRIVQAGGTVAISVDGGRGPRQRVQSGIMLLAKHSGCAVIPATGSCRQGRQLATWDRMLVPFPWTSGVFLLGAPMWVPRDADKAELARLEAEYEDTLNCLTAEADQRCGRLSTIGSMATRQIDHMSR